MLERLLPHKGSKLWFGVALVATLLSAAAVTIGIRLIIGPPAQGAGGPMQAFVAGTVIFGSYWLIAAAAGYFGLKAMPLIMGAGNIVGIIGMLWSLQSLGTEGWGGAAAVGALLQVSGIAFISGVLTEVGVRVWSYLERRRRRE